MKLNSWPWGLLTAPVLCIGSAAAQPTCDTLPTSAPVLQTRSVPGPVIDAQCNASMIPGLQAAVRSGTTVPGGGELRFVDGWQAHCELFRSGKGTGQFKSATVCAIGSNRTQIAGVWKCQGPERVERVQVGTENPRQACERARVAAPAVGIGRAGGAPEPLAAGSRGEPASGKGALPRPNAVSAPSVEAPKTDLVIDSVSSAGAGIDVVVRNVGNAPNLLRCVLEASVSQYNPNINGPHKWEPNPGCRHLRKDIQTLMPGQRQVIRTCGFDAATIDRMTGLLVSVNVDHSCDPGRTENNTWSHRREPDAAYLRAAECARRPETCQRP